MPRLIIRNYSKDTTEANIIDLFRKIGEVEEVYMPPPTLTGIVRGFTIVKVKGADENVQKYIKALNGSIWNGSKINIEVAKEFYKDRLQSERSAVEFEASQRTLRDTVTEYGEWKEPFISLRVKANEPCVKISTIPGLIDKGIIPCGWKGFDARPRQKKNDRSLSSIETVVESFAATTMPASCSSVAKPTVTHSSATKTPEGGGLRKGFGNVSLPTVSSIPDPATRSIGDIGSSVDCCIDEHDTANDDLDQIDSRYLEDEYSEPCIKAEELTEEVLQKERSRALRVLDLLLNGREASEDKSDSIPACVVAPSTSATKPKATDAWNSVVIKRFDPLKMAAVAVVSDRLEQSISNDHADSNILDDTDNQSNYAKTNILKDIFYKEGGVGWNDNHTDVVKRSSADADDSLFLVAEKLGIDVRKVASSGAEDSNRLSFNFFGSEADNGDGTAAAVAGNDDNLFDDAVDLGDIQANYTPPTSFSSALGKRKQLLPPLSLNDVRELGSKFCRVSNVETIKKQWEEQREKLVLDYKKKTRESKKKGISTITSPTAPALVAADSVRSSNGKGYKKFSGGNTGGKARGGVKYSKKRH